MPGTQKLQQGSTTTCVSSGSTITSGHLVAANGASNLTNSTNLDYTATAMLTATPASAPAVGTTITLYHVPTNGSNAGTVDTSTPVHQSLTIRSGSFVWTLNTTGIEYPLYLRDTAAIARYRPLPDE